MTQVIDLHDVTFSYPDGDPVCRRLSLDLGPHEAGCLLGMSGCGKTSVLRLIAGFEQPSSGTIHLNGKLVAGNGTVVSAERRRIGFVFQDYALFPHLTVSQNIQFGLSDLPARDAKSRAAEMLELVRLENIGNAYPHELSGGQRQRVALARALAPRPVMLLMDEPFSNLDIALRESLGQEVRELLRELGMPALMVTHDQNEAFAFADRIGVMNNGSIEQWDTAYNLYHRPATRFVANFVGEGVLIPATITSDGCFETELGHLGCGHSESFTPGSTVELLLRPDDILHDDASDQQAEVLHKSFRGAEILYALKLPSGARILSLVPSHHNHGIGQKIGIRMEIDHVVAFAPPN